MRFIVIFYFFSMIFAFSDNHKKKLNIPLAKRIKNCYNDDMKIYKVVTFS